MVKSTPSGGQRQASHRVRSGETTRFTVGGQKGYLTTGKAGDAGLTDITIRMAKQGSTLAGMMDAVSQAVSLGLVAGAPPETYVVKFSNMRFTPAGCTDDAELPYASSVMDYVARRLAVDHLPEGVRADLGILTADRRAAELDAEADWSDVDGLSMSAPVER